MKSFIPKMIAASLLLITCRAHTQKIIKVLDEKKKPVAAVVSMVMDDGITTKVIGPVDAKGEVKVKLCGTGQIVRATPDNLNVFYRNQKYCSLLRGKDTIIIPRKENVDYYYSKAIEYLDNKKYSQSATLFADISALYKINDSAKQADQSAVYAYISLGKVFHVKDSWVITKDSLHAVQPTPGLMKMMENYLIMEQNINDSSMIQTYKTIDLLNKIGLREYRNYDVTTYGFIMQEWKAPAGKLN